MFFPFFFERAQTKFFFPPPDSCSAFKLSESVKRQPPLALNIVADNGAIRFRCPACTVSLGRLDTYKRHWQRAHGSAEPVESVESEFGADPTKDLTPAVTAFLGAQKRTRQSQNVSIAPHPDVMDEEELKAYEAFKTFISSCGGGSGTDTTVRNYSGKMRSFLQHCRRDRGLVQVCFKNLAQIASASEENLVLPPDLEPFFAACVSPFVQKTAICGYIKLVRWLKDGLLTKAQGEPSSQLPADVFNSRCFMLQSRIDNCDALLRSVNKKGGRASYGKCQNGSANAEDSPSLEDLEDLVAAYKSSPLRKKAMDSAQCVTEYFKQGIFLEGRRERSPFFLRNFLALELLLLNGKLRYFSGGTGKAFVGSCVVISHLGVYLLSYIFLQVPDPAQFLMQP